MSRSLNRVALIGRAGAAAEIRSTASGRRVATFSVATDRGGSRAEVDRPSTDWHRIVAWDALAEQAARTVGRGDRVFVDGRIEYRTYRDAAGRDRYVTEIVADDLIVFESRAPSAEDNPMKERIVS